MKIRAVNDIDIDRDMWENLKRSGKPIVMYGMGNGADKIIEVFSRHGIEVADFFASDGFVRHQNFHGKTVMSYAEICEKYDDFCVVVSFGSNRPEVLENVYRIASERELYIPDVPVVGGSEIFDMAFFNAHREELAKVCEMLADDKSKETFCDVIMYKLTGKLEYLRTHTVSPDEVMNGILRAADFSETADLGAYNGDSIRELAVYSAKLRRVTAMEPDTRNFRKLNEYGNICRFTVDAHNCAAWNEDCTLAFTEGGNRNSNVTSPEGIKTGAKIREVSAMKLDSVYTGRCDYIKYDVEGAEYEALMGSRETICRERPKLLVSMYHRSCDLYRLPLLLRELGYSKLYLRRYEYVPAWDLNLLCEY